MGNTMFVPGQVNEFCSPLYDTYTAAQAAVLPSKITMFQAPQSASIGPELTNMVDAGKLSAGESIDIFAIRCQFLGTLAADILLMMQKYQISLVYGGKTFFQSTIDATPGGGGIAGYSGAATTASATTINTTQSNNGLADPRAVYSLLPQYPIKLEAGPIFAVVLSCGGTPPTLTATASGGVGLFMRVYLDGLRRTLAG